MKGHKGHKGHKAHGGHVGANEAEMDLKSKPEERNNAHKVFAEAEEKTLELLKKHLMIF